MATATGNPVEIVKAFMKAMEPLDYDTAVTFVSADCTYTNPPPLGSVKGPAGIRSVLEPFFAPTLENEFRVLREASSGPLVFLERLDRHRLKDKWVELPFTRFMTA
jgi:limonene-1,2-epoxide hydrolase